MSFIITKQTRAVGNRPQSYRLDRASLQAKGLAAWFPDLRANGTRSYGMFPVEQDVTNGTPDEVAALVVGRGLNFVRASNESLEFDGVLSSEDSPVDGAITTAAWVIPDTTHTGQYGGIAGRADDFNGTFVDYYIMARNGTFHFLYSAAGTSVAGSTSYTTGELYHVAITRDKATSGTLKIYVNGVEDGSGSGITRQTDATGQSPYQIGRWYKGPHSFDGKIFEVRQYDRELSASEIWGLYDAQTRWDLYQQTRRAYFPPAAAGGAFSADLTSATLAQTAAQSLSVLAGYTVDLTSATLAQTSGQSISVLAATLQELTASTLDPMTGYQLAVLAAFQASLSAVSLATTNGQDIDVTDPGFVAEFTSATLAQIAAQPLTVFAGYTAVINGTLQALQGQDITVPGAEARTLLKALCFSMKRELTRPVWVQTEND